MAQASDCRQGTSPQTERVLAIELQPFGVFLYILKVPRKEWETCSLNSQLVVRK